MFPFPRVHRQLIRWTCIVLLVAVILSVACVFSFAVYRCSPARDVITCTVNFFYMHLYAFASSAFKGMPIVALSAMLLSPYIAVVSVGALVFLLVLVIKRI